MEPCLPDVLWKHGEAERLREGPQAANRLPGVYNGDGGREEREGGEAMGGGRGRRERKRERGEEMEGSPSFHLLPPLSLLAVESNRIRCVRV